MKWCYTQSCKWDFLHFFVGSWREAEFLFLALRLETPWFTVFSEGSSGRDERILNCYVPADRRHQRCCSQEEKFLRSLFFCWFIKITADLVWNELPLGLLKDSVHTGDGAEHTHIYICICICVLSISLYIFIIHICIYIVLFCNIIVSQTDKPNSSRWSSNRSIKMKLYLKSAWQQRLLSSARSFKSPTSVGKSLKTRLQLGDGALRPLGLSAPH